MLKKLLITGVVLATCSSTVFARPMYKGEYKGELVTVKPPVYFCAGPYLGLSTGPRINYTGAPSVFNGIEVVGSAGWGWMFTPDFYIAAEIFGGDSFNVKDYGATGLGETGSVRTTWNFGVSLLPGVMINDSILGYVRISYIRAHFRNNPTDTICDCDNGTNRNGWQVGLGGESNLCGGWDVRGEYVYSQYTNSIAGIGIPRAHQFTLGLVYKFI